MIKYFGYHRVPKFLLRAGSVLEVDLYLFLPANDTMIRFRSKGDELDEKDATKLQGLLDTMILSRSDQRDELTAWIGKSMAFIATDEDLAPDDPIDPLALRSSADALLGTFHPTFGKIVL